MYHNIYSGNPGAQHWYKNYISFKLRKHALEKWQHIKVYYPHQFEVLEKLIGIGLILISASIMIYNESRAVQNSQSYHECLRMVRVIVNPNEILPENEGNLVHVNGYLDIPELLEDYPYGVSIYAVKLKRRIQLFQWEEEIVPHTDDYDQPQYKYKKVWRDKLINSRKFMHPEKHKNPRHMPVRSEIRVNDEVRIGAFNLGQELKEKFNDFTQFTSGERPESSNLKMHMGLYYHSTDIWNPSVGDLRIQFSFAGPADSFVSVIAKQMGNTLLPFEMNTGQSILYLHEGNKNHFDIFTQEHSPLILYIWLLRSLTWIGMIIGFLLSSKLIIASKKRNKIMRNLMNIKLFKLSLILTCTISLFTMGCIWCQYKVLFGCLLIVFAGCIVLYYVAIPPDKEKSCTISRGTCSTSVETNREFGTSTLTLDKLEGK